VVMVAVVMLDGVLFVLLLLLLSSLSLLLLLFLLRVHIPTQVLCLRLLCNLAADSLTLTGRPAPGPIAATAAQRLMQELVHVSHSIPLLLQHTLIEADNPYLREYAPCLFSAKSFSTFILTLCKPPASLSALLHFLLLLLFFLSFM
jgi:hypothetical protein